MMIIAEMFSFVFSKPRTVLCVLAVAMFLVGAALPAHAREEIPTRINADKLRYSPSGKQVVFSGKVTVKREDFVITADTITVYLGGGGGGKSGRIDQMNPGSLEKIVARGNVRLEQRGRIGTCKTATFLVAEGVFKMEGDPVLTDGKNRLTGEVIKYYTKDSQSEVVGGEKKRVEALFFTPKGVQLP